MTAGCCRGGPEALSVSSAAPAASHAPAASLAAPAASQALPPSATSPPSLVRSSACEVPNITGVRCLMYAMVAACASSGVAQAIQGAEVAKETAADAASTSVAHSFHGVQGKPRSVSTVARNAAWTSAEGHGPGACASPGPASAVAACTPSAAASRTASAAAACTASAAAPHPTAAGAAAPAASAAAALATVAALATAATWATAARFAAGA